MAPVACREPERDTLTRGGITSVISYWPTSQKTRWYDARICLGERPTETYNHFDLCYSFKILCWAEYSGTQQLHRVAKNYTAGQPLNRQITYERALRNLIVLMFSHYINHIEKSSSLEGHWTLMVHECLSVAATLGWFHRWQRWVEPGDWDKPDWMQVLVVSAGDFRYKYSPALNLLGNVQHLAYAHPKLLGRCYDNIYHQGQFIRDLSAHGKPPTKAHTQKIYNQEYEEVVAWVENTIDLTDESPTYPLVPTSLRNPEIVLHPRLFREHHGLPELPPCRMAEPWEYELDGTWGLIDLSWSQRAPQIQLDDIDRDLRYSQYLYQEDDEYEDNEEEMEVDERVPGKTGSIRMSAPTSTRCSYHHPEATYSYPRPDQTPGSPHSIHTNTDVAMEMGGLGMVSGRMGNRMAMPRREAPPEQPRVLSTLDLVSSITKGMTVAATEILEKFTRPPPMDDAVDAAIRECFQQRRAATVWEYMFITAGMESSTQVSVFDWLGHRAEIPQKDEDWEPQPKMTPRKIERGCQTTRATGSEAPRSTSQKRWSQSRPWDEGEPKKGHTDNEGRSNKVQVGIDWSTMGIQRPISRPDPWHPSFKPDLSEASKDQQPKVKSAVVSKGSQKMGGSCSATSRSQEQPVGQGGRTSNKTSGLTDPEKLELKEKPYQWIPARVDRLDPKGYM